MLDPRNTYQRILTDPKSHDPNHFVYMVKGILLSLPDISETVDFKIAQIYSPLTIHPCSLIGMMDESKAIDIFNAHRGPISRLGAAGGLGFIIRAHPQSIRVAWETDIDSNNGVAFLERYEGMVKTAYELLTQKHTPGHNEIVLHGAGTTIEGVFYRISKDPKIREWGEAIKARAQEVLQKKIPLVPVPEDTGPHIKDKKLEHLSNCEFYGLMSYFWEDYV